MVGQVRLPDKKGMKSRQAYVVFIAVIAAIGGLLFGFDTAIVAGATRYLKDQFALDSLQEGWAVSIVLIGCMFGAGLAGPISDRIGRKRFMLVSVNQMAIVIGILLAYFVNWAFAGVGPSNWRWMYGMGALPAVVFFFFLLRVPESPRWLVKKEREEEALRVLSKVNDAERAVSEVRSIRETLALEKGSLAELFRPGFRRALLIAVALAILQQITGINAILYYAPRIFERAGFERISAIGQSTIVGLVNMVFTIVAILLVDRVGRKPLLLIAAAGMGISQFILGAAFRIENIDGSAILLLILLYIAFFAMAMGPIVWVVMSEIFPTRMRGSAMAIATVSLWIADFAVTLTFPVIADRLSETTAFWFYALMCAVDFLFMIFLLPETKGKTLEEIERRWLKKAQASGGFPRFRVW